MTLVRSLWAYRGFILGSVKREFQSRYRNSLLGGVWTILNPLAMIVVYTVVFSQVMHAKLPGIDDTFLMVLSKFGNILLYSLTQE
jgi:lipopolysaccharide transport system permease protein